MEEVAPFVIITINWPGARLTFRHKRLQRMVENVSTVLGRSGHVLHGDLDGKHMSMAELRVAFDKEGRVSVISRSVLPA
jgi:hypothetical protein